MIGTVTLNDEISSTVGNSDASEDAFAQKIVLVERSILMREIKFRGKDLRTGEWEFGTPVRNEKLDCCIVDSG